ncbi:MAG: DUF2156 domain-containing protein [Acidobacteriota bacterium]
MSADPQGVLDEARELIDRWGYNATAYQILNPGIERWFDERRDAVVGYVTFGRYRVVAGSPICAPDRLGEVIEAFEHETHRQGLFTCYFAADDRLAGQLARRGPLDRILLGAQPVWDPTGWPAILARKASLRAQLHRARNKGVTVERWEVERARDHPDLHRCLDEWLTTRGLPPLHFLVEPETLGRLWDRRVYVAELDGDAIGFVVASPVPLRRGWLIEQFVRGHDAPNGTTESMLDVAFRDLATGEAEIVTLGLSPLSHRADVEAPPQPLWIRLLLGWVRAHGRRFYNFDGLDAFKAKLLPDGWEPIYAITSERRFGLGTLWAISGAFGTMSPPKLLALALWRGLRKEVEWLRARWRSSHRNMID